MNLKYCPQRDVPSISKTKMFNSTVSKYDPRTGRTTRLQNCIPYEELLARDFSRCCYQIRTIIPPTVSVVVSSSGIPRSFSWTSFGSGTVDYGNGSGPFSTTNTQLTSTITVPNVKIYSDNLSILQISAQSVVSIDFSRALNLVNLFLVSNSLSGIIDVSKSNKLQELNITGNSITGITGLNTCLNINQVNLTNNAFTQASLDSVATDIYSSGAVSGSLYIGGQPGFINNESAALVKIRDERDWSIITA
jgi:hypothetical protein